ncbi:hypothetical protein AOQ84DRAFT_261091, partial [Glonium stellatum]
NAMPPPKSPRLIDCDCHALTRMRPMKVLVLGMPRTGADSMFLALKILGYNPYHMKVAIESPKYDLKFWNEAYKAKFFGKGQAYGRAEFDKLVGEYDALTDIPPAVFVDELIQSYPDAKVILTIRDPDEWLACMKSTVFAIVDWPGIRILKLLDPFVVGALFTGIDLVAKGFFGDYGGSKSRQAYIDHYEYVRKAVPKNKLLEFHQPFEWKPLCDFLGTSLPNDSFPRMNNPEKF